MTTYCHDDSMIEISGFGGKYEACCQAMLDAGVKYIIQYGIAGSEIKLEELTDIHGIIFAKNDPTKALMNAIADASEGEATGMMVHEVMIRLAYIAEHGWGKYCVKCRKHGTPAQ